MKFNTKKIIILILFVISLIITVASIRNTYGKYTEEVNTAYEVGIRKWYVVVNGEDIQDDTKTLSQILAPNFLDNEHITDGVLVPGREGYFEVDLDYTKVDVPFTYSFEIAQTNEATKQLSDFEYFGYSIIEEASGFEFDTTTTSISYIGIEEIDQDDVFVIIDRFTGDATTTVTQTTSDAETGVTQKKIFKASLTTPQVSETPEVVEGESNFLEVGRVATVTMSIIDVDTGEEIEAEKTIFRLAQEYDETTKKTRFTIMQPQDPTQLESYERYQNLGIYFRWNENAASQTMDDYLDTSFRGEANPDTNVSNTILKYQGTLKFKQLVQSDIAELETLNVTTP